MGKPISILKQTTDSFRILAAMTAYEYLITVGKEVDMIHRRKWSATTWLFVLNRYVLLASAILAVVPVGSFSVSLQFRSNATLLTVHVVDVRKTFPNQE